MSTIIIDNANKEQISVISKLAKMLKLNVTTQDNSTSSKAEINAAIIAYESGKSKGLKLSLKDFKKLINGIRQSN